MQRHISTLVPHLSLTKLLYRQFVPFLGVDAPPTILPTESNTIPSLSAAAAVSTAVSAAGTSAAAVCTSLMPTGSVEPEKLSGKFRGSMCAADDGQTIAPSETKQGKGGSTPRSVTDEQVADLIQFIHGKKDGIDKLVDSWQQRHPTTSKRQIKTKILEIASKDKSVEGHGSARWVVKSHFKHLVTHLGDVQYTPAKEKREKKRLLESGDVTGSSVSAKVMVGGTAIVAPIVVAIVGAPPIDSVLSPSPAEKRLKSSPDLASASASASVCSSQHIDNVDFTRVSTTEDAEKENIPPKPKTKISSMLSFLGTSGTRGATSQDIMHNVRSIGLAGDTSTILTEIKPLASSSSSDNASPDVDSFVVYEVEDENDATPGMRDISFPQEDHSNPENGSSVSDVDTNC